MSNDLISRSALKEHKFLTPQVKVIGGRHNGKMQEQIIQAYQQGWNDCIDAIIDNAPTVDFEQLGKSLNCQIRASYGSCDDCELSCPRNELINLLGLKRAKGEWIVEKNKFGDILHCSICGARPRRSEYGYDLHDKFCNECGADMRGEKK